MPSGLTGRNFAIAIVLAIGLGVVGFVLGNQIGALWLGYSGSVAAAIYLVIAYTKAQEDEPDLSKQSDRGRRGR